MTNDPRGSKEFISSKAYFDKMLENSDPVLKSAIIPSIVLKAFIEEKVTTTFEKEGPGSSHMALVAIGEILSKIHEERPIDIDGGLAFTRDTIRKVYAEKPTRVFSRIAARLGQVLKNVPVEHSDKKFRAATESFIAPETGAEISVSQYAAGEAALKYAEIIEKHFSGK